MARSPMLDVGKRGSCFTGLENHFGKNDPLWIFNPLSSGSSPKHCLKCLKVFEVQFTIYAPLLSGVYKWSLWILGTDCKHISETFSWEFMTNSRGPSWVLKIEFDVISEQVFEMRDATFIFPCLMGGMRNLTYSGYLSKSCLPRPESFSSLESIKKQEKPYFHFFGSFSGKQKWPLEFSPKKGKTFLETPMSRYGGLK